MSDAREEFEKWWDSFGSALFDSDSESAKRCAYITYLEGSAYGSGITRKIFMGEEQEAEVK